MPGGQKIISILIEATVWALGGAVHLQRGDGGGDRAKVIAHHHTVVLRRAENRSHPRYAETWARCPRNRLAIALPLVSQVLPLCLRGQAHDSARQRSAPVPEGATVISGFKYFNICSFNWAVVMVFAAISEEVTVRLRSASTSLPSIDFVTVRLRSVNTSLLSIDFVTLRLRSASTSAESLSREN
ncbi:MAG: hypothetical protein ACJZ72_00855 [Opitutales bacterium]